MAWDEHELEAAARRAYERGRLRRSVPLALLVAPLLLLTWPYSSAHLVDLGLAVLLAVSLVGAAWRGEGWGQGVLPGLLAGVAVLVIPLLSVRFGHLCTGGACWDTCLLGCTVAGAVGGAIIGLWPGHVERTQQLLSSLLIAALAGSLGCFIVGVVGVGLMLLTLSSGAAIGRTLVRAS